MCHLFSLLIDAYRLRLPTRLMAVDDVPQRGSTAPGAGSVPFELAATARDLARVLLTDT
ncbi:MAG: hypothetical protein AVDCRST_MAG77-4459 [uncultured Chloroflexi bacterium]|uniref:Uncharacterized protein n=1 Tax=uncultured Chloroflexota bacterium TaxID=166587 RepID=A0A6J4JUK2_9CHLR|nr:MAG: hypothetical protein AVDCRST_MAG77-4459 [uncultured Chloroflexota bacterium]